MSDVKYIQLATRAPLDASAAETLQEILDAVKDGRVTAFAIVAKEAGFSRWSSWRGRVAADRYNLLGQLSALSAEIANTTNES